jgi:hypothetical protein
MGILMGNYEKERGGRDGERDRERENYERKKENARDPLLKYSRKHIHT